LISGCGTGSIVKYVNPAADLTYVKKVAVLPFNNLSDDRFAGERVRSALIVDLMSREAFEVLEQGEVSKVMDVVFRMKGIEEGKAFQIDKETLNMLGEKMGVQSVIMGSVDEYLGERYGAARGVTISLKMLDTGSGTVLWQANVTESGASPIRKLVGLDELDISTLTRRAIKRAIDTLL
jgi:TolB-like protein